MMSCRPKATFSGWLRAAHILVLGFAALVIGALTSPANADANQRKVALQGFIKAMSLCIDTYDDARQIGHRLNDAGFHYQTEHFGEDEVVHWFLAPGQFTLLIVLVDAAPQKRFCAISTNHFNVADALTFARGILGRKLAGQQIVEGDARCVYIVHSTHPQAQNEPCSGFHIRLGTQILQVSAGTRARIPVVSMTESRNS